MTDNMERRWHLTLLSVFYLLVCSSSLLRHFLRPDGGTIPLPRLILCAVFAIAAATYLRRPRIGHVALTALTALTLLAIGTSDPGATAFHLAVLMVLGLPLLRKTPAKPATAWLGNL